jgi:ketosteroid isomerase-like protein
MDTNGIDEKNHASNAMLKGLDTPAAQVVMSFHYALETGDKKLARKHHADDVQIFEGGNIERSADQYAHHHMLSDMKYLAVVETKMLEHQIKIMGNTAVSMSKSQTQGTYKGKSRDYQGMETMVLEKQVGQWKIVHILWSH